MKSIIENIKASALIELEAGYAYPLNKFALPVAVTTILLAIS